MPSRRRGFSLLELVIACGLVGLVLALGVGALMEVRHVARVTEAKLQGRQTASKAVQEVATLLRRAHIVYFTGRPLQDFRPTGAIGAERRGLGFGAMGTAADPASLPVPDALYDLANLNNKQVPYDFGNLLDPTAGVSFPIAMFRFFDFGTDGTGTGGNITKFMSQRLRSADTTPGLTDFDLFFPSPLAYFAEAHFNRTPAAPVAGVAGAIDNGDLPLYWDFHVLYLAPMDTSGGNANAGWLAYDTKQDRAPAPGNWRRSKIPFELRLLTITGVDADRNGQLLDDSTGAGRARDPQTGTTVLRPPFDYDWTGTVGGIKRANYDPIRVPGPRQGMTGTAVDFLDPNVTKYRWVIPAPGDERGASGERINDGTGGGGMNLHPNYDNLGNDPPTELALTQGSVGPPGESWPKAFDRVLAQYVDPDSVHGTCVRLENNLNSDPTKWQAGAYRRYVNAIGDSFLYNHHVGELDPAQVPAGYNYGSQPTVPRRALISVTTRYRQDRREKFSFATETMEVELEGAVRFQGERKR